MHRASSTMHREQKTKQQYNDSADKADSGSSFFAKFRDILRQKIKQYLEEFTGNDDDRSSFQKFLELCYRSTKYRPSGTYFIPITIAVTLVFGVISSCVAVFSLYWDSR